MGQNKQFNVVVNGVVVNSDNQILIARRWSKDSHEANMWTTPGGTLEVDGEQHGVIEDALRREIMEEVGVEIQEEVILVANNTFVKSSGANVLAIVFLCFYKSGTAQPLDETDEVVWLNDVKELDNYRFPPNVKEYFQNAIKKLDEIRQ